jgi:formyl-CoA transferase
MFALASILGALNGRKHSADPVYLDISISESLAMWMMPRYFEYLDLNRPSKSVFMGRGPYGVFETKDNHYITIGVVEDHFWVNLCKVLGLEDLSSDSSLKGWHTRNHKREQIVPRIKAAIKEKDADYWIKTMTDADVPVAPVCDFENWKDNPQFQDRGFFPEDTDKKKFRRFPVNNLIDHALKEAEPLVLGMDNTEIMKDLGLSEGDIKQLKNEGAI